MNEGNNSRDMSVDVELKVYTDEPSNCNSRSGGDGNLQSGRLQMVEQNKTKESSKPYPRAVRIFLDPS
jgi:hypothetical protein